MIKITTTLNEYLVSLPYSDRSRAKSIRGYKWDEREKVWRYPKNETTHEALLAEFGPDESNWIAGDGTKELSRKIESLEIEASKAGERIKVAESLALMLEIVYDLWNTAESYGFSEESELGELVHFTKAAYEGNYRQGDLAAELAIVEARLAEAKREIAELKALGSKKEDHSFLSTLTHQAWGRAQVPQVLANFNYDSRGAIELQNFLYRVLSQKLNRIGERTAFADLIKEAEDIGIMSNSAARVCQTLRIQRNHFAHENVEAADVFPRAALCLFSFVIVYRDLLSAEGGARE